MSGAPTKWDDGTSGHSHQLKRACDVRKTPGVEHVWQLRVVEGQGVRVFWAFFFFFLWQLLQTHLLVANFL